MKSPYFQKLGRPIMIPSFVCYADILGYSELSQEALNSGNGPDFLSRMREALSSAYKRVRENAEGFGAKTFFSYKVFTDNIVVGYPVYENDGFGEAELGDVLSVFAEFQAGLAMEGFFIRGGIAYGDHYMDDEIVFGRAFLEAAALDKTGGPPRLALAPSAVAMVKRHLSSYGTATWAPQYESLMEDADGMIFSNYLNQAFVAFPEAGVFFEVIERHRQAVVAGLHTYKANPGVRAKYEWAARYHNFICQEFVDRNPVPHSPDADEIYSAAAEEAQDLLRHIIDIEGLAATPRRISLAPIKAP